MNLLEQVERSPKIKVMIQWMIKLVLFVSTCIIFAAIAALLTGDTGRFVDYLLYTGYWLIGFTLILAICYIIIGLIDILIDLYRWSLDK